MTTKVVSKMIFMQWNQHSRLSPYPSKIEYSYLEFTPVIAARQIKHAYSPCSICGAASIQILKRSLRYFHFSERWNKISFMNFESFQIGRAMKCHDTTEDRDILLCHQIKETFDHYIQQYIGSFYHGFFHERQMKKVLKQLLDSPPELRIQSFVIQCSSGSRSLIRSSRLYSSAYPKFQTLLLQDQMKIDSQGSWQDATECEVTLFWSVFIEVLWKSRLGSYGIYSVPIFHPSEIWYLPLGIDVCKCC